MRLSVGLALGSMRSSGGGSSYAGPTIINTASAASSAYDIDVTNATRVVVRGVGLSKGGAGTLGALLTTGSGQINSSYVYGMTGAAFETRSTSTKMIYTPSISGSATNVTLLAVFSGFKAGLPCHVRGHSAYTVSGTPTGASGFSIVNDASELTTQVLTLRICEPADFSSGLIYVDVIEDANHTVQSIDFSSSTSPQALSIAGTDYHNIVSDRIEDLSSFNVFGWRYSDDVGGDTTYEANVYASGYQNEAADTFNEDIGDTRARLHNGENTTDALWSSTFLWGFNDALQGGLGYHLTSSDTQTTGHLAELPGTEVRNIELHTLGGSGGMDTGDVYVEAADFTSKESQSGALSGASSMTFTFSGKNEARLAITGSVSAASGIPQLQFDDGTGFDTTLADYEWSYWNEAGDAHANTSFYFPLGANSTTNLKAAVEIYGLGSEGPVIAVGFSDWGSSVSRLNLYAYTGKTAAIEGIRLITSTSATITADYSIEANAY